MRSSGAIAIGFFSAVLAAPVAAGQTERIFHLTHTATAQQMQQMVTTVRAVLDIRQISMDAAQKTVSVNAETEQIDTAGWLIREFDQPAQPGGEQVYRSRTGGDDIVRVFFLTHARTPQELGEIITNIRSVLDIRRGFIYTPLNAVTLRGTGNQIASAAWLVSQLDQPVGAPAPATNEYKLPGDDSVRVLNLTNPQTPQQLQQMVTLIRLIADLPRLFTYNSRKAVTLRGTSAQIALAEWLVNRLDRPAPPAGTNEYKLTGGPDDLVRVFYIAGSRTPEDTQKAATQVRTAALVQRIFVYNPLRALAVRGTVGQIATAGKVIEEMENAR